MDHQHEAGGPPAGGAGPSRYYKAALRGVRRILLALPREGESLTLVCSICFSFFSCTAIYLCALNPQKKNLYASPLPPLCHSL